MSMRRGSPVPRDDVAVAMLFDKIKAGERPTVDDVAIMLRNLGSDESASSVLGRAMRLLEVHPDMTGFSAVRLDSVVCAKASANGSASDPGFFDGAWDSPIVCLLALAVVLSVVLLIAAGVTEGHLWLKRHHFIAPFWWSVAAVVVVALVVVSRKRICGAAVRVGISALRSIRRLLLRVEEVTRP